jgi:hypothetical protein
MDDDGKAGAGSDPQGRATSGDPPAPPQEAGHGRENGREPPRRNGDEEEAPAQPAADGEGGSDRPGTTLPGYG